MNGISKVFSAVLTGAMVASFVPAAAFAQSSDVTESGTLAVVEALPASVHGDCKGATLPSDTFVTLDEEGAGSTGESSGNATTTDIVYVDTSIQPGEWVEGTYSTFEEAVAKAPDGFIIQLKSDAVVTETSTVTNKSLIIDLNEHSITSTAEGATLLAVASGASVTLQNGIVNADDAYTLFVGEGGSLTAVDCQITAGDGCGIHNIGGTFTATKCSILSNSADSYSLYSKRGTNTLGECVVGGSPYASIYTDLGSLVLQGKCEVAAGVSSVAMYVLGAGNAVIEQESVVSGTVYLGESVVNDEADEAEIAADNANASADADEGIMPELTVTVYGKITSETGLCIFTEDTNVCQPHVQIHEGAVLESTATSDTYAKGAICIGDSGVLLMDGGSVTGSDFAVLASKGYIEVTGGTLNVTSSEGDIVLTDTYAIDMVEYPNTIAEVAAQATIAAASSSDLAVPVTVGVSGEEGKYVPVQVNVSYAPGKSTVAGVRVILVNEDGTETPLDELALSEDNLVVGLPAGYPVIKVVDESYEFTDVESGVWYDGPVSYVSSRGIMTGFGGSEFGPNVELTRGMMVELLNKYASRFVDYDQTNVAEGVFSDTAGKWYEASANWGAAKGITTGYQDGTFDGDTSITREQAVTMLWRYANKTEADLAVLDGFEDASQVSDYAKEAFAWAVNRGIISGKDDGTLSPNDVATRAEIATMIQRFCCTALG
jgi:hypothetical protein